MPVRSAVNLKSSKRLAHHLASLQQVSSCARSVALRWCRTSCRALKARTAVPLRGGGRREDLGTGSRNTPRRADSSYCRAAGYRRVEHRISGARRPFSRPILPEDAAQTTGRATTHGDKSARFEDLVAGPPRNAQPKCL